MLAANSTAVYLVRVADGALVQTIGNGLPVERIALTSDNAMVVLGHRSTSTLWRVQDGTALHTFSGEFAALSPNGSLLATTKDAKDAKLWVWHVADGVLRYDLAISAKWITDAAFSPDGQTLAVGDNTGIVALFKAADGTALRRLPKQGDYLYECTFTPNSITLACRANDKIVRLWRVADGTLLHTLDTPASSVDTMRLAPDGTILATASYTDSIRLWRVTDGSLLQTIPDQGTNITFSPDGTRLVIDDNVVREWQVSDGSKLGERIGPQAWRYSTPSSDGALRLTSGIGVWRAADGTVVGPFHEGFAYGGFAPDGQTFWTAESAGVVNLRRTRDGRLIHTLKMPNYNGCIQATVFAPDGTTIAASTREGAVHIWRVADGTLERTFAVPKNDNSFFNNIQSLAYTPDGRVLAVGASNGPIWLWNIADGTVLNTLRGHGDAVTTLAFSADGALLSSVGRDGTTRLWGVL